MLKKNASAPQRRQQLEQERDKLAPIAAEFDTISELEKAAGDADEVNRAFRESPEYVSGSRRSDSTDPISAKAIELSGLYTAARSQLDQVRSRSAAARRRLLVIDGLLTAHVDVAKHEAELRDFAADGMNLEQREATLGNLCASMQAEIAERDAKHEAETAAAADERITAKLEGREIKPAPSVDTPALAQLRADLGAATRQRSQAQQQIAEIVERSRAVFDLKERARRLAAQLEREEVVFANKAILVEAEALGADTTYAPTDLEVADRRRAIAAEAGGPWLPTRTTAPMAQGVPIEDAGTGDVEAVA
jgi:hypothetical protein